jgi:transporter family-2 protein
MTKFLAVLNGMLISIMIMLNGKLASIYGNYHATVFIHLTGFLLITLILIFQRKRIATKGKIPLYLYTGGIIGVATSVFCNIGAIELGVTVTLALSLLAQTITSLVIDHNGLLGVPRSPFHKHKLVGTSFILLGILVMIFIK